MGKDTITIPVSEYERLKIIEDKLNRIDLDLVLQFKEGLEDLKAGRIRRVA